MNRLIKVEPFSKEAFAPYGHVLLREPGVPPIKSIPPVFADRIPFEVDDGPAEFVYALLKRKEFKFTSLERHLKVTQGFFPLFGGPAIISVAPATDPDDLEALPSPDSVRCFLLESYTAFVIHRGIWHGTILPLEESFGYILATRKATTDDSINPLYDGDCQIRDLGVTFEIQL
ncbi:ureidoglycolate lyase [Desulfosporosinus sp. PR]|uniref:ureidoglycolate lyase n=1 Tax=Candidatus Desulfosporosinus nitrosoreducens TaxID=3401928 RepID=UPI0027E98163|nr:ureidoglycolate lyase [Desulfosporosinus sp. PR]MDQ7092927.1 ureidoglycolate lyase [Desulfosporosinus sp. PR]